jgi:tetratricopeptide (TPR) repeat protein
MLKSSVVSGIFANWLTQLLASVVGLAVLGLGRIFGWYTNLEWISLAAGYSVLWIALIFLYFRKAPGRIEAPAAELPATSRLPSRTRRLLLFLIVTMPIVPLAGTALWRLYERVPPRHVLILVANFEEDGSQRPLTETILQNLEDATRNYPDIKVEHLDKFIPWETEEGNRAADQAGAARKASVVLWGNYAKTTTHARVVVHFHVLGRGRVNSLKLNSEREKLVVPLSALEDFSVGQTVSSQMSYVTFLAVGIAHNRAGDDKGALSYYDAALRYAENEPQDLVNPEALYGYRGISHFNLGDLDACEADQRQVLALSPKDVVTHFNLAAVLTMKGSYDDAIAEAREAIALKPDSPNAYYYLGVALSSKRQYGDAVAELAKALTLNSNHAGARNAMGMVLDRMGRKNEAVAEYQKAIAIDPEDPMPHYNLAACLDEMGRYDQASAEYRASIVRWPDRSELHDGLGTVLEQMGRYDEAIVEFKRAILLKPNDALSHYDLGMCLLLKKHLPDDAIAELRAAATLKPEYFDAHLNLAAALMLKYDYDDAILECEEAIRINPNHPVAHKDLGILRISKGEYREGIKEYEEALRLNPNDSITRSLLNRAVAHERHF